MAKTDQPIPETTVAVVALTPVRYNGSDYAVGDAMSVRASCVAQLFDVGAVAPAPVTAV